MTGIDREALAYVVDMLDRSMDVREWPADEQDMHRNGAWKSFSERHQAVLRLRAEKIIAHLAATDQPTDTGLREERLAAIIAEGMGVPAGPSVWATARLILAAPDPGPDQAAMGLPCDRCGKPHVVITSSGFRLCRECSLRQDLAERRADPEFMARIRASIAENKPILDRLAEQDGPDQADGRTT